MILSNDTITKPAYDITKQILKRLIAIAEKVEEANATLFRTPSPELRKKNGVKTIKASLGMEGNVLSVDQITAIIKEKKSAWT